MANLSLQLERLRRHYLASLKTYDKISLLDLSVALRIWTEIVPDLMAIPEHRDSCFFKSGSPHNKVKKVTKNVDHLYSYLIQETITYASSGNIASGPEVDSSYSVGSNIRMGKDGSMSISSFFSLGKQ